MDLHRRNMSGKPQVRVRPVLEREVENGSLARSSHKFVEEIVGFKNPGALEEFMKKNLVNNGINYQPQLVSSSTCCSFGTLDLMMPSMS